MDILSRNEQHSIYVAIFYLTATLYYANLLKGGTALAEL